jgi:ribosomal protein S18 acetylase RimI-like enzyme
MFDRVIVREFRFPEDHAAAVEIWASMEIGVQVGRSDAIEEIQKKLQRDPDLFLVAEVGAKVVGTIIGGFDGRRGMIYHLAVQMDARQQGIGDMLLKEVETRLQAKGCKKCYLLVSADNIKAMKFYENRNWYEMKEDRVFGKEFP